MYPRLKVIVNDINEIWSLDLAYVAKRGVRYLLVAVDCLSRYLLLTSGTPEDLCTKREIIKNNTHSEKKSAFAERDIRSLKSIIYKYLEFEWT